MHLNATRIGGYIQRFALVFNLLEKSAPERTLKVIRGKLFGGGVYAADTMRVALGEEVDTQFPCSDKTGLFDSMVSAF